MFAPPGASGATPSHPVEVEAVTAMQGRNRLLLIVGVMLPTVMHQLDGTIVNVALPHIAGGLSATPNQISWVLTTYLVATGVVMPLTGYLVQRWGQRQVLFLSTFGFVAASGLCGLSTNLTEIVLCRVLQGAFGAPLIPLSQAILIPAFSVEERGRAMAIWGLGVMVGPILGPTLGGYITDALDWRWAFFINLPLGALALMLAWRTVPPSAPRPRALDWVGLVLLIGAVGGFQFVIDRGNQEDWFESGLIQFMAAVSVVCVIGFVVRSLERPEGTLIDLAIFRDQNFSRSCLLLTAFSFSVFGAFMLQPLMLESLFGYPPTTVGLIMAPRGVASMVSMLLVGRLVNRVPTRALILTGVVICGIGSFGMTRFSLDVDNWLFIWPTLLQGFAVGLVFVPLATIAYATLPRAKTAEATGIYNLLRTMGSSIGISIVATVMSRQTQVAWHEVGSHIHPYNPALQAYVGNLGIDLSQPQATGMIATELGRQAQMLGILDGFVVIAWSICVVLPFVFLVRRRQLVLGADTSPEVK